MRLINRKIISILLLVTSVMNSSSALGFGLKNVYQNFVSVVSNWLAKEGGEAKKNKINIITECETFYLETMGS